MDYGTKTNPLLHIEGTENLADLLTKKHELRIEDVSIGSKWIEGLNWMRMAKSDMNLTSYEDLKLDKTVETVEDKVNMECFPESFLKEFTRNIKDVLEELNVVDEIGDENLEFSVLAAKVGRVWQSYLLILYSMENFCGTACSGVNKGGYWGYLPPP